jgi:hypothetical protein
MEHLNADPRFGGSFRTRTGQQQAVALADRVALAAQGGAELFVSIHHNGLPAGTPNRTEAFYCRRNSICGDTGQWQLPALLLHDEVVASFGYLGRGALEDSSGTGRFHFYVLRYSTMPSALCEASNLNDAEEEALFGLDPAEEHAREESLALYRGILAFFGYSTAVAELFQETGSGGEIRLAVSPQPASGPVEIYFASRLERSIRLLIFDSAGRMIREMPPIEGASAGRRFWDGRGAAGRLAPAGSYWLAALASHRILAAMHVTRVK